MFACVQSPEVARLNFRKQRDCIIIQDCGFVGFNCKSKQTKRGGERKVAIFQSFFSGGFECSTHRSQCGRRLDLIAATAHDKHAVYDYARLREQGIRTVREGIRWHLIEQTPNRYDFSSM